MFSPFSVASATLTYLAGLGEPRAGSQVGVLKAQGCQGPPCALAPDQQTTCLWPLRAPYPESVSFPGASVHPVGKANVHHNGRRGRKPESLFPLKLLKFLKCKIEELNVCAEGSSRCKSQPESGRQHSLSRLPRSLFLKDGRHGSS